MRARTLWGLLVFIGLVATASAQQLVINEIYYDSAGTDVGLFTEILGPPEMSLNGYALVGGRADGTDYRTVPLDGMVIPSDGRMVIAQDATVSHYDYIVPGSGAGVDWQNGPNKLELRQGTTVIDGICYGVSQFMICEGGTNGPDVASGRSIGRCPDGRDTNNNALDTADMPPTPGVTNTCPVAPVDMSLCEAMRLDGTGVPVHLGVLVHITSPLVVMTDDDNFSLTNLDVYATDGECCINVFDFGIDPVLAVGDAINVTGTITIYHGKFEITSPGILVNVVSSGHPLPTPQEITAAELTANEKDYEGCLISICGLHLTGGGDPWPGAGLNANVEVVDATAVPITLRVDKETDIDGSPAPVEPFTCIGIASIFDGLVQTMPRGLFDILGGVDCPHLAACCVGETCSLLFQEDCLAFGGVYHGDWLACTPNPCALPHVCCVGVTCALVLEEECATLGGTFHPEWNSCEPPNPCDPPHVCCVGETCMIVPSEVCTAMGGVFHPEWDSCDMPNPCALPHVCCVGETCVLTLEEECATLGGVFHPEWNACAPNPCRLAHVCCVGETCALVLDDECAAAGGIFHPEWDSCGPPNPCALPHVCCVNEDCFVVLETDCAAMSGVFHPEWDSCGPPNPCQVTPALPSTWGGVKNLYR